jgi:hypothetical protein
MTKEETMKIYQARKAGILMGTLAIALGLGRVAGSGQEVASKPAIFKLGDCQIAVLGVSFWRDWMPIVAHPGPDKGSPLHVVVKLRLNNPQGADSKLAWTAAVIGEDGKPTPVDLRALPEDGVLWNRTLRRGESRDLTLAAQDGPYLPIGNLASIEIRWTDQNNAGAVLRTQKVSVERTD